MAKASITADIAALSIGGFLLTALAGGMLSDNSVLSVLPLGGHQDLLLGLLGLCLIQGPVMRWFESDRRIMTVTLYRAEKPSRVWRTIFVSRRDMQEWLGKSRPDTDLCSSRTLRVTGAQCQAAPLGDGPVVG